MRDGRGNELEERFFQFASRVVRLYLCLAKQSDLGRVLGKQVLRSGTSIGANYQESQAGQSRSDFVAKAAIALKEARETHYWLRLITEADLVPDARLTGLLNESEQIKRILGAVVARARRKPKVEGPPPSPKG
jgi:four helix bundle protein